MIVWFASAYFIHEPSSSPDTLMLNSSGDSDQYTIPDLETHESDRLDLSREADRLRSQLPNRRGESPQRRNFLCTSIYTISFFPQPHFLPDHSKVPT